jgi:hypothetical protein
MRLPHSRWVESSIFGTKEIGTKSKARTRIVYALTVEGLEHAINTFLSNLRYQVHGIEFFTTDKFICAAIVYDEDLPLSD